MIDKGVSMLHAFYEQAGTPQVESVEHGFTITIRDVDTGEPLEEQLVGTMDLLIREDDRVVIVEHKTAARSYTADQLRLRSSSPRPTNSPLGSQAWVKSH